MNVNWIDLASSISNLFALLFGLAIIFPKVGEAILGRIISASLEKQKADYAKQLESHKAQLLIELETVKLKSLEQIEQFKSTLIQRNAETNRLLSLQQEKRKDFRSELHSLLHQDCEDTDADYKTARKFCTNSFLSSEFLPKTVNAELRKLDEYIEEPLSLTETDFGYRVRGFLSNSLVMLDRAESAQNREEN